MGSEKGVQLRLFHPAMVSFILQGDIAALMDLDARIASLKKEQLDLTEYEYALLLEGLTAHGTWAQLAGA